MSLTELQLPTKAGFYGRLQSSANQMNNLIHQWRELAEFIGKVETVDLDSMGIASGQVRTDLINFRTVINEMISMWEGNPVTPTNTPESIIDLIRSI